MSCKSTSSAMTIMSVPSRIAEARRAILDRAEETLTYPSSDENRALNNALHALIT